MAQKSVIINWTIFIVLYVIVFTLMPVVFYIDALRSTKLPEYIKQADNLTFAYTISIAVFFFFMGGYKIHLKLFYIRLSNRFQRQNMTIITQCSEYYEEGVGIVGSPQDVLVSKIEAEEYINDDELQDMFTQRRDWLKNFYNFDERKHLDEENIDEEIDARYTNRLIFVIPESHTKNFNFSAYTLDYLKTRKLESYMSDDVIQFLANEGVKNASDFINLEFKDILNLERKSRELQNTSLINTDFRGIRSRLKNTLDIFSAEEIEFFKVKTISNFQEFMDSDLEKLTVEFNEHFKTAGIEKIKNQLKKLFNLEYKEDNINLVQFVKDLKEQIVEKERKWIYDISDEGHTKYVYLKLVTLKMIDYESCAYFMQFDKKIKATVSKKFITKNQMERFMRHEDDFDESEPREFDKALVILPVEYGKCFDYQNGMLGDFHGIPMETEQLTDAEYIFPRMLDHERGILICNNCSYTRKMIRLKTITDPFTLQKIERDAALQLLNEKTAEFEGQTKFLELERTRSNRKDDQMDYVYARMIDDIDPVETATKWSFDKKPTSVYHAVVLSILSVAAFSLGIALTAAVYENQIKMLLDTIDQVPPVEGAAMFLINNVVQVFQYSRWMVVMIP